MSIIQRRLFWKVYLTLLTSLVAVAILMGSLWWLLGESPRDHWGAVRIQLTHELMADATSGPNGAAAAVHRLGNQLDTDISLYGPGGTLLAAHGAPITDPSEQPDGTPQHHHVFTRIDLPDGRAVLVRLKPPAERAIFHILSAIMIVAGGVGLAAFPMTARLTRKLEALRSGIARWGQGDVWARVDDAGRDEVAAVAHAFNAAAERINALMASQKALLANASHELRSPLARLRMAVDLWIAHPDQATRDEMVRNLAELDALVEEILLSSRLDHPSATLGRVERVDLLGLAAEEAVRVGASLEGEPAEVDGSETLLRRLLRNLLENAVHHGRVPVEMKVEHHGPEVWVSVSDQGDGIPPAERERIFEPFYRPVGRSESGGGWGLGLSLVRQIAARHGGRITCEDSFHGSGSRFVLRLPSERGLDLTGRPGEAGAVPPGPAATPHARELAA